MDSSSIAAIAKNQKISYFSLKHFSKDYNENHLINENKKYLALKHEYVNIPQRKNLEEFKKIMAHSYNVMPTITHLLLLSYVKELNH